MNVESLGTVRSDRCRKLDEKSLGGGEGDSGRLAGTVVVGLSVAYVKSHHTKSMVCQKCQI
jgi:hypothetical protein